MSIDQAWYIGFNHDDAWDERYWWRQFKDRGCISIGYPDVESDLSHIESSDQMRDEFDIGWNSAKQLERFVQTADIGDIVFAKRGMRYQEEDQWAGNGEILAIGVITGAYVFEDPEEWYADLPEECKGSTNYHHREVEWLIDLEETAHGSLIPDVPIKRGTISEAEYTALKAQLLDAYDIADELDTLEERSKQLKAAAIDTDRSTVWIEKSDHSSEYKQTADWGLGEVIWCPQTMSDESQSVHYENIKRIAPGDVILHLDQEERVFTSASLAADTYTETTCPEGSKWDEDGQSKMGFTSGERPAYKIPLAEHTEFDAPLDVDAVLNRNNKEILDQMRTDETVVYNKNLNLNQDAYLTKAPDAFVALINDALEREVGHGLPHITVTEGATPEVYQCPIKPGGTMERNYRRTIIDEVPRTAIEGICEIPVAHETLRVWGNQATTPATPGDYLLFAKRDGRSDGTYTLLARIADATILDDDAAAAFTEAVGWGDGIDESFPHVMFLDPIHEVELDRDKFWEVLGYKGWPNDTYSRVNFDRDQSRFDEEYGSVTAFLEHIKADQVYPDESDGPEPIEEYESTEQLITDVRERLTHTDTESNWLLDRLGEYLIHQWSEALSGYKPSDEISEETAATFDQLRAIYERFEPELETKASELGVGSLESFPPKKALFLGWIRLLQEDLDVEGAALSHPRLNSILKATYSTPTEPESEHADTDHILTTHIQTADPTVYKFTAPPDYWLTSYAYAALGLEEADRETWQDIEAGDVILFHSRQAPGWEELDTQEACILGAGIVRATTTEPDKESWWYDEQPDRPKAETFPYLVAFDRLYGTGDLDAIDFSTGIDDKSVETVNADLAALTVDALAFKEADAISAEAGDNGFPRYGTITSLAQEQGHTLATELAQALASVPPVAVHESFTGDLDADEVLDGLYFPDDQGEQIVTQIEGALRAGKHAILTGPPGTGKTEIARRVGEYLVDAYPYLYSGAQVTTATADWSTFDTVGGYMPNEDETEGNDLEFTPGLVLNRFKTRQDNVQRNEALVIDELNRADIDKAFGQLFTVLSGQSVQLPYTKDGEEVDLAPIGEQSLPAPHEYRIPDAWSLFATLNTYDKTSLYEMSYAFMRRFAFIRVPAPDLGELDGTELRDLLATYTDADIWDIDVGAIETPASVDPLLDVGLVWQATNDSIDDRAVGPAVVRDMIEALVATPSIPWERRLTQAVISYIFPQLEGVPKRKRVVSDLADVGRLEETYLDQAARDMLQVGAIQETDEAE